MSLTIENGSRVAGANSYVTTDELTEYATARGLGIPTEQAELERRIINAMDFVEARRDGFAGEPVARDQPLSWPRYGAYLDGWPILENEIPLPLKLAVLDIAARSGEGELLARRDPATQGAMIEKTVGPLTTKWAEPGDSSSLPVFPFAEAQLNRLMSVRGLRLTAYRG